MDPGEDIIDVLYRYRDLSYREAAPLERQQQQQARNSPARRRSLASNLWNARKGFANRHKKHHGSIDQEQQYQQGGEPYPAARHGLGPVSARLQRCQRNSLESQTQQQPSEVDSFDSAATPSSLAGLWEGEEETAAAAAEEDEEVRRMTKRSSVKKDVIYQDEEDPEFFHRRRQMDLVELSNGVKLRTDRNNGFFGGGGGRGGSEGGGGNYETPERRGGGNHHRSLQRFHQASAYDDGGDDDQFRQHAPPLPPCRDSNYSLNRCSNSMSPSVLATRAVVDGDEIADEAGSVFFQDAAADHNLRTWRKRLGDSGSEVYCSIVPAAAAGHVGMEEEPIYISQKTQTDKEVTVSPEMAAAAASTTTKSSADVTALTYINKAIGLAVMSFLAYRWSSYLAQLHENQFWFTHIKEVEREISYRTEQGLYYSYFKHLVQARTLGQGIEDLKRDNVTEHLRTINIFYRFNIHPELFLATVYRFAVIQLRPILFYTYFVFALQGFFLCTLFVISWILSGSWLSGILTAAFLVCHRNSVTRVEFTLGLREHFSLPFIFAQFTLVGQYLGAKTAQKEKYYLGIIYVLTVLFMLSWQFAQFVLLLQAVTLYGLAIVEVVHRDKVCKLLAVFLLSVLTNWYMQFYQPMIINSLVASFIPIAIVVLQSSNSSQKFSPGIWTNLARLVAKLLGTVLASSLLNTVFKVLSGQEADNHIYRFVQSKFGFEDETDFETRLYLCLAIFQPLGLDYYISMSRSGAMPIYLAAFALELACIVATVFKRWHRKEKVEKEKEEGLSSKKDRLFDWLEESDEMRFLVQMGNRPEVCYHVAQSLLLAVLAMSTLRMRCFWGPYICVFAGAGVAHLGLWNLVTSKLGGKGNRLLVNFIRHLVLTFVISALFLSWKKDVDAELGELREFYDPDTVDLMEWINRAIPSNAAFTGSMQLLAGVRLCTGRPLTNHPHFEDKELRERTKELYQIYARRSPEEVHDILVRYNSSYIILEDSICLSRGRCGTNGIMDLSNGQIPDDGIRRPAHLVPAESPRFCDEIRHGRPEYAKLFSKVFENKTFRVYKVLPG